MHLTLGSFHYPSSLPPISPPFSSPSLLLSRSRGEFSSPLSTMKLAQINPGKFFRSKKSRSITRSDKSSFSSEASSEEGFKKLNGLSTPTSVLPEEWTEAVYFELKQAFEMIDRDGDGKISKEELELLLNRLGAEPPSKEELQQMVSEVDRDGDGCITLEEFHAIGSAFEAPTDISELRETFDFFDSDRDGKISAEELFRVFQTIGDAQCTLEDCRRMTREVDRNGDGYVGIEDFTRMMAHR